MTVDEVVDYFRLLVQEPDDSFLSNAQVTTLLKMGYREFRSTVQKYDDRFYVNSVVLAVSGSSYDLATGVISIMGATPTDPRMKRLISIQDEDLTSPGLGNIWQGVKTRRALFNGGDTYANLYMLEGTTLWFETDNTNASLRVTYDPVESVDWVNLAVATFIDELEDYHDLIALYASRRYQAIDAADNRMLSLEIKTREEGLMSFFSGMRSVDDNMIQREDDLYW